ncbi:type IV toxin-antitoxin system AbiEi family antitoxin domain-containing protein [Agromyces rhizosphaerae]|uniref:type IV toxin-antitoxin system AbiEi family antitoxin domain-containing protein n=1 Tax=Agromyces rhizosphaerae TaxID=88374 RepID=UPI0024927DE1|nr:type IV toxin-antitoxin system AbiEi family antitoxin domain-containing protein [Agromyces rhizosphaerae]
MSTVDGLGGIATRRQLLDAGHSPGLLTMAVRAGVLRRVRRGHYASTSAERAAVVAVRVGGRLGCVSAAASLGMWAGSDAAVHIALPANAARLRTRHPLTDRSDAPLRLAGEDGIHSDRHEELLVLHWCEGPVAERGEDASSWRTDIRSALDQVATCQPRADVLATFESAVAERLVGLDDARGLLAGHGGWHRELSELLTDAAGSGAESHFGLMLRDVGLEYRQQVRIDGVGRVDFLVARLLVVEVDGRAFHSSLVAFEEDRRRDGELLARGYPTLRVPAREVLADPDSVVQRVIGALAAARLRRSAH